MMTMLSSNLLEPLPNGYNCTRYSYAVNGTPTSAQDPTPRTTTAICDNAPTSSSPVDITASGMQLPYKWKHWQEIKFGSLTIEA